MGIFGRLFQIQNIFASLTLLSTGWPHSVSEVHLQDQDLELYLLERVPKNNIWAMDSHLADCGVCDQRLVQEISLLPLSNLDPLGMPVQAPVRVESGTLIKRAASRT